MEVSNFYLNIVFASALAKTIFSAENPLPTQDIVKKLKMINKNTSAVLEVDIKMST
jgi:hypothetical protein